MDGAHCSRSSLDSAARSDSTDDTVLPSDNSVVDIPISFSEFPEDALKLDFNHDAGHDTRVDLEKNVPQQVKPRLERPQWHDLWRYTVLDIYRRLFSIVFVINIVCFGVVLTWDRTVNALINATAINLLVCGLARQPLVVNTLFVVLCSIPRSAPLRLRRIACKIYHFGGVHSGSGVAAFIWYLAFVVLLTVDTVQSRTSNGTLWAVVVLAYIVLVLLLAIVVAAYPTFRFKRHDYFELTHRFAGWTVVILVWIVVLLFASQQKPSMGRFLVSLPAFWCLIVITCAIIQPWAMLRKVRVKAEVLSGHAIRLHFSHTTMEFGQGLSLARHPLRDWHSFAAFPDRHDNTVTNPKMTDNSDKNSASRMSANPSGARVEFTTDPTTKFSCLISKAGDWTSDIIAHPPTHIWKRGVPVYGFGYVMRVFNRVIVVTTGSGIGPCLSFLGDDNRPAMRVIWQTRTPMTTYGRRVVDLVKRMDADPVILDTNVTGRVDMLPLVIQLYHEFQAEAVCIVSNPRGTKTMVFGLESQGIPAFGPIFDS